MTQCAWPGCTEEGEFPAPVDPRNLRKRQFFCKNHIREFNKKWNGLEGFNSLEINAIQDTASTWLRPTRPIGENPDFADLHFDTADQLNRFFEQRVKKAPTSAQQPTKLPPDVQDACAIFGVDKPPAANNLKQHYIKLMKEHHPDKHGGAKKAEEFVKKINVAYQILQSWQQA
jgi:hypothetical protein